MITANDQNMAPTTFEISPSLSEFNISRSQFFKKFPQYQSLAVGACIFSSKCGEPHSLPRLLLIQRAATERSFPNLWEIPGGSCEFSDPTILHSVAREVLEETGLHLTRLIRVIGDGIEFTTGRGKRWLKLAFEVEVAELNESQDTKLPAPITVTLDPQEHQDFAWVMEEEIKVCSPTRNRYPVVSEAQRKMMLQAFGLHGTEYQSTLISTRETKES